MLVLQKSTYFYFFLEYELKEGVLPEALSNADRMGYLIYQSDKGRINYVITPPHMCK